MTKDICPTCEDWGSILDDNWWGCGDPDCCGTCPSIPCPECSKAIESKEDTMYKEIDQEHWT